MTGTKIRVSKMGGARRRLIGKAAWLLPGLLVLASFPSLRAEERLAAKVGSILQSPHLEAATVAVEIAPVEGGESVFARNPSRPMIPASNMKVVTVGMALLLLGADYEFQTPMVVQGAKVGNELQGDLWIVGSGDPTLSPRFFDSEEPDAPLMPFLHALNAQGIDVVAGDLVLDDRVFDRQTTAEGWPEDQLDKDYCAPVGGLALNGNCLEVLVTAGADAVRTTLRPDAFGYQTQSVVVLGDANRLWAQQPDERGIVVVRGEARPKGGTVRFPLTVRDPTRFFGAALRAELTRAGIHVRGQIRRPEVGESGAGGTALFTRRSPLLPALYVCGKESDNLIADQLFKTCGALDSGVGSFASGAVACLKLLEELGVDTDAWVLFDGSGLSRNNRVTAHGMVTWLKAIYGSRVRSEFIRSLPISGIDGSLEARMTESNMLFRVRAKTGYLSRVSGLTGYVMAGTQEDPQVYAFSILINGFRGGNDNMKRIQDDICRTVVAWSR